MFFHRFFVFRAKEYYQFIKIGVGIIGSCIFRNCFFVKNNVIKKNQRYSLLSLRIFIINKVLASQLSVIDGSFAII
jgi:hypothetical protein